jgi:WD40 repeat protein
MKTVSSIQWDTSTLLVCLCLVSSDALRASEVACSPNGTHFAATIEPGRIIYRNAGDNTVRATFYICHPMAVSFSEDGRLLAAAGGRNGSPAKVKVWRVQDHQLLCEITTRGEGFKVLALSSDGQLIAGASAEGRVEVWRVSDGQALWSRIVSNPMQSMLFSPDSRRLAVQTEKGNQRSFDAGNGRPIPDRAP